MKPVNNGINYQPQLVSRISAINTSNNLCNGEIHSSNLTSSTAETQAPSKWDPHEANQSLKEECTCRHQLPNFSSLAQKLPKNTVQLFSAQGSVAVGGELQLSMPTPRVYDYHLGKGMDKKIAQHNRGSLEMMIPTQPCNRSELWTSTTEEVAWPLHCHWRTRRIWKSCTWRPNGWSLIIEKSFLPLAKLLPSSWLPEQYQTIQTIRYS